MLLLGRCLREIEHLVEPQHIILVLHAEKVIVLHQAVVLLAGERAGARVRVRARRVRTSGRADGCVRGRVENSEYLPQCSVG